jgi:hypothetical protein
LIFASVLPVICHQFLPTTMSFEQAKSDTLRRINWHSGIVLDSQDLGGPVTHASLEVRL